jgi:hypothetical protein
MVAEKLYVSETSSRASAHHTTAKAKKVGKQQEVVQHGPHHFPKRPKHPVAKEPLGRTHGTWSRAGFEWDSEIDQ